MEIFILSIIKDYPVVGVVFAVLGLLVVLAQVIVVLTPSKKDDLILENAQKHPIIGKMFKLFVSFAPIQKKEGEFKPSKE